MKLELRLDGVLILETKVDGANLSPALDGALKSIDVFRNRIISSPVTQDELRIFLGKLEPVHFRLLKEIALAGGGLSWTKIRRILEIPNEDDFEVFSFGHYEIITMHFRAALRNHDARIIWWNERDWWNNDWDSALCSVHIDGPALSLLQYVVLEPEQETQLS
jgi:hypothetical protein